jgi:hypothetical protein
MNKNIAAYRVARTFASIRTMSAIASSALVARLAPAVSSVSARKAIGGAFASSRRRDMARARVFPSRFRRARVHREDADRHRQR